ncbi:MAG TPA: glycine zipper family protein [Candidatus Acidoferrales bacterium]|nr:glycine zipper family protein [Candidatus Acidoferrales bacterium]
MKATHRIFGTTVACLPLLLTGCTNPDGTQNNTASGALIGGALGALTGAAVGGPRHGAQDALIGAAAGVAAGLVVGSVMDHIDAEQRARLQQTSPQTLQTLQHNDQMAQQSPPPATASASDSTGAPAQPAADAPTPLKVDDIKAMTSAGIKPQSIIDAIKQSKTTYTPADIDAAQQASPPVDPSVIAYMKNPTA